MVSQTEREIEVSQRLQTSWPEEGQRELRLFTLLPNALCEAGMAEYALLGTEQMQNKTFSYLEK